MKLAHAIIFSLFAALGLSAYAQDANVIAAEAVAKSWLQLQDTAKYSESWEAASTILRAGVTEVDWKEALAKARSPLGPVKSRHLKSAQFTSTPPAAPTGEYVVIQYETEFANGSKAIETITPQRDSSGAWKVSGYFLK